MICENYAASQFILRYYIVCGLNYWQPK